MADLLVFEVNALKLSKQFEFEAFYSFVAFGIIADNSHMRLLTCQKFVLR